MMTCMRFEPLALLDAVSDSDPGVTDGSETASGPGRPRFMKKTNTRAPAPMTTRIAMMRKLEDVTTVMVIIRVEMENADGRV